MRKLRSPTSVESSRRKQPRRGSAAFLTENDEHDEVHVDNLHHELHEADILYDEVASQTSESPFNTLTSGHLPRRSPYVEGETMGRGADFAKRFRHFVETGGVAKYKNCVAMNIRLNDIRDIDSANGNGTFKVSFFIDTAFWVPWWDAEHFEHMNTTGTFSKFEPELGFPEVDVESGMLRWGLRSAEFGKNARQHETQLGQNYTTVINGGKSALKSLMGGRAATTTVSVKDPGSHWPRMWRVCLNDDEIAAMAKMDKKERKKLEPTNDKPMQCNRRLTQLLSHLDKKRELLLPHRTEGIGYVTYEIHCTHRNEFQLHEFPFDMHSLKIIVRVDKKDGDPMNRAIVPIAHDKAFFVSGRVPKMVDYHLARNLDWEVSKEPLQYGGHQRISAAAIVRRKPGYFVRNYVIVVFLLTSSSFTSMISRPEDFNTRTAIIFTVLLAVVAFKYSGSDQMPRVSYATILDAYILLNFYVILGVATISFFFAAQCATGGIMSENPKRVIMQTMCSRYPGQWYGFDFPAYNPVVETGVAVAAFALWLGTNAWYWHDIWKRIQYNLHVVDAVGIGWMSYKFKGKGQKGRFDASKFIKHLSASEKEARGKVDGAGSFGEGRKPNMDMKPPVSLTLSKVQKEKAAAKVLTKWGRHWLHTHDRNKGREAARLSAEGHKGKPI